MARIVLTVLDEPLPASAKVVVSLHGPGRPVLVGGGRTTFLCGACGRRVARRIDPAALERLVLQCPACGRYNATAR